ncbi:actin-like ATPase domain-containing protein, partial [Hypoxylon fragiforme]|uniref:actin-like ATPase domain-containing protein n=1 Tax=Hypoxylon fragiforme TaxID=63214 RepID=UPI0020C60830
MANYARASESEDRIIIALDFGTTYSGIAYTFCNPGKKPEIVPILDWPGLKGHRQPKVPSLICYDPDDPTKFKWGGQVSWRDDKVQGVKLLLDPDQPQPLYLPTGNKKLELKKLPKDPVDVVADFIGAIYKHALSKIESAGIKDYFDFCQKQFVLSVPAVWSDKAKDRTLRAAKKAGIHPVTLIKEPEAAALYTLHLHERALNVGDAFLVCDAGGGTVDLITYEVTRLLPTLELAEVVPGSGGMAGSLGLNTRFTEAVHNLVGDKQWATLEKSVGWFKAQEEFDKVIKLAFRGDTDEEFYVSFPQAKLQDDPIENLVGNCWTMTGMDVEDIFDPLVWDVLGLINDQVKKAQLARRGKGVKGIFLVGGFGSSQYLKERVEQSVPNVQVIQPDDAWAAIVKGAVLSRVPEQAAVTLTKAVRHYGVEAWAKLEPTTDLGQPTRFFPDDGFSRVLRNTWYIYSGEDLKRDKPIRFSFQRTINCSKHTDDSFVFEDELIFSESTLPPTHPGKETGVNCTLTANLAKVDKSLFPVKRGANGKLYYEIDFDLVISTTTANMKFSFEIGGKEFGTVDAKY